MASTFREDTNNLPFFKNLKSIFVDQTLVESRLILEIFSSILEVDIISVSNLESLVVQNLNNRESLLSICDINSILNLESGDKLGTRASHNITNDTNNLAGSRSGIVLRSLSLDKRHHIKEEADGGFVPGDRSDDEVDGSGGIGNDHDGVHILIGVGPA